MTGTAVTQPHPPADRRRISHLSKFREGAGKTVAVRAATTTLDASRHTLIYLPNPRIGIRGIHGVIAQALGKAPCFYTSDLIPQVEAALAAEADEKDRHVLLAIDFSDRPCECPSRPASLLLAA